ncbi:ParB family chromosome partitioning protein [Krasilnikovia cinnamomea]|uniref:ParB family chromosome partitioning protein n=1 Tax=Krasilnikovia cinnamomea TaxID=349313 RepID=A0A4Q7Z860_9ACTN|nr:ParB N-terminal domain-containing protein [Krasilnikovia cinnamomea]RZU46660.1 ParB family chromosome partitioning protein [Krasilnikovia cinnamomea]
MDRPESSVSLLRRLGALSPRLRQRRFELLPLRGPGSPGTDVQGRAPGDSTVPRELADLISSIAEIGYLQPILVEEIPSGDGPPRRVLALGERRLRAGRWGAVHMEDNPHFQTIPAVVCPGPLTEEERRVWQLVENLAREPLTPGEQAAGLLFHRCAVLVGKLLAAGRPVPAEVYALDDPAERFRALERLRGGDSRCAAPWSEVLTRLGLQMSPRKARELVRAFEFLPRDLVEDMDAHKVALHTRIRFVGLRRDQGAVADEIWAAVKSRGRPDLLAAAVTEAEAPAGAGDPGAVVDAAERGRDLSNLARAEKLRASAPAVPAPTNGSSGAASGGLPGAGSVSAGPAPAALDTAVVTEALDVLRRLSADLRVGARPGRFDAASLRLLAEQILQLLDTTTAEPAAPAAAAA